VKNNRSVAVVNQHPDGGDETDWASVYERRMRRFNLEVVLAALIALILVIVSFFFLQL
jgi:hypothetical protein